MVVARAVSSATKWKGETKTVEGITHASTHTHTHARHNVRGCGEFVGPEVSNHVVQIIVDVPWTPSICSATASEYSVSAIVHVTSRGAVDAYHRIESIPTKCVSVITTVRVTVYD